MSTSFGEFIRQRRLEKSYTVRKFCELLDVSQTFLSRMERNEIPAPGEEKIRLMAKLLDIHSAEKLIFMANKMPEDVKKMIIERPDLVPLLRLLSTRRPEEMPGILALIA